MNEVSARLVATGVVLLATMAIVFDLRWLTVALAYGFVARVLTGPSLSPLGQLVTRVVTHGWPWRNSMPGPPKRFAQAIRATFTVTAAVLTYGFGAWGAAQVVLGILLVAASLGPSPGSASGARSSPS